MIATHLYAVIWYTIDSELQFGLPLGFYEWLDDRVGTTTQEGFFDLYLWSTSVLAVIVIHGFGWVTWRCASMSSAARRFLARTRARVFPAAGWISWWLVLAYFVACAGEFIYEMIGGKVPRGWGFAGVELLASALLVGLLHLAGRRVMRCRHVQSA